VWAVGANPVTIAILPATFEGDQIEQSSYGGEENCVVDGEPRAPIAALREIGGRRGHDYSLSADRLDEMTWVVRVEVL
jgi:hypothetical protein